ELVTLAKQEWVGADNQSVGLLPGDGSEGRIESLHGCEQGREYEWTAGCFGWFTACFTGTTQCFANRLNSTGQCSTSLCTAPIGMLGDIGETTGGIMIDGACAIR